MLRSLLRRWADRKIGAENARLTRKVTKLYGDVERLTQERNRADLAVRTLKRTSAALRDGRILQLEREVGEAHQDLERSQENERIAIRDRDANAAQLDERYQQILKLQEERDTLAGIVEQLQGTEVGKLAVENARLRASLNDAEERLTWLRLANEQAHRELAEARAVVRHG